MRMLTKRSAFNFYESFSDLIFCTLVLFLMMVLFLVLSIDRRVDDVRTAESGLEQRINYAETELKTKLATAEAKLQDADREIERRTRHVTQQEAQLDDRQSEITSKSRQLDRLLGTRRFTGHSGETFFTVAADLSKDPPEYFLIPRRLQNEIDIGRLDESEAEKKRRQAPILREALALMQNSTPLRQVDLQALLNAFSPYVTHARVGQRAYLGVKLSRQDNKVERVLAVSSADRAGILEGDRITHIGARPVADVDSLHSAMHDFAVGDTLSVTLLRDNRTITLDVELIRERLAEVYCTWHGSFVMLASGVRDANGMIVASQDEWETFAERFKEMRENIPTPRYDKAVTPLGTLPTLLAEVDDKQKKVVVGTIEFSPEEFVVLLESIGGRGAVVEIDTAETVGSNELPSWVTDDVLIPAGYINKAPMLTPLN